MRIGRLEIQVKWHKQPKPYKGKVCDICGQRISHKGEHILSHHPEYPITTSRVQARSLGRPEYTLYNCGFCDYHSATPAYVVKHIRENHLEVLS
jgi:hypothetical protein